MSLRARLVPLVAVAVLAAVTGCARTSPGGTGPQPGTHGPDDLVLRMEYVGGFVPVEHLVGRVPTLSVYGDGRVITEGPVILIYPGPALPNLQVRQISQAGIDTLVAKAVAVGVGQTTDFGQPPIADAPSTVFTVVTDAGPQTSEVYALEMEADGLTADQRTARQSLRDLADALNNLPTTLGAEAAAETQPYRPTTVAAISRPWTETGPTDIPAQLERAWPAAALPGSTAGMVADLGCLTVTGADAAAVLSAAATANALTPWVSDGRRWLVIFRPLLPDESSCADLG